MDDFEAQRQILEAYQQGKREGTIEERERVKQLTKLADDKLCQCNNRGKTRT